MEYKSFGEVHLYVDKIYNVEKYSKNGYCIDADNMGGLCYRFTISKISLDNYFYSLAETRKIKLNKIYEKI